MQLKFLILIEFPNCDFIGNEQKNQIGCGLGVKFGLNYAQYCEKIKETGFFHILLRDYLFKLEAVVVKPPEWKFMVIIARNAKF